MVPIKYNLRSLRARAIGSLMTVLGTAIVVWASVFAFGLYAGLENTLNLSAEPLDILVLRQGSTSDTASAVTEAAAREVAAFKGLATDAKGTPLCSPELVVIGYQARRDGSGTTNVTIRGVLPIAKLLRNKFEIVEGRDLTPGKREAVVSRAMANRFNGLQIGETFDVQDAPFTVVGYFDAGGSAVESEIWTDQKVLGQAVNRTGSVSSLQLRAASKEAQAAIVNRITSDEQIALKALTEEQYYADQAEQGMFLKYVGRIIAILLTIGAMFAVANTMYGAIASRGREIGTLRALGFSRTSVLVSFLMESLVLCILGAVVGCLCAWLMPSVQTGTLNGGTFTEIVFAFNFGPKVLLQGAMLAVFMGLVGGFMPALRSVRMKVVDALREV